MPTNLPSIVLCLNLVAGAAACTGDDDTGVPSALRTELQGLADRVVANGVTPGVVLTVSADGETWSTSAGVGEIAAATPLAPTDRFRAGSNLKTFVATAVLQAEEAGRLELDDVLTDHLPPEVTDRIANASSIQIGMLLAHRSGIPDWVNDHVYQTVAADPQHVFTLTEVLDQVGGTASFPPGERFEYSNTNYNLLAEILTRVSGRDWRAVIREQVIARAGLASTFLPEPGDTSCTGCAHGYLPLDGQLVDLTRIDPSMAGASGGHALISTTADLARFLDRLRDGALFDDPDTVVAMQAFLPASHPDAPVVGYGLGMMMLDWNGSIAIGHLGGTAGYQSFMLYVPAADRYLSGFINVNGDLDAVLAPALESVERL